MKKTDGKSKPKRKREDKLNTALEAALQRRTGLTGRERQQLFGKRLTRINY
jgi:hypothetical protein